ncbi:MAG: FKBP-type peptidyl-prolyl cis-trans isomerase, partial [Oscillospiraceae bacterium]
MKRITKGLCVVMAAVLLVSVFAGCKKKDDADTENFNYSAALGDDGFWKGVKASKLVTLPENYLSIEIPANVHTITDEAVGVEVGKLMDTFAKAEQLKNRAVADGDTLNIDYVGSIGGKEFEGGSTGGGGTSVTVGTTQYIDDFINQLIGHKPGDTFNIEVTFPDNYGKEELNGKDAVFVTTINY